jgi:hypothetical protein
MPLKASFPRPKDAVLIRHNTYAASDFRVHRIRQSCERGARVNNSIKIGVKGFTSHHGTSYAYVVIWTAEEGIPR